MKTPESYAGARVTVMGLGLHGGGASAARFLAREGAEVTVTDLRTESELGASLDALASLPIRFVLGRHEDADFAGADVVVKNPAVRRNSRYLTLARRIETDISIFLARASSPIIAVTGTKGKSSTSSATHHILCETMGQAYLGGNITRSPLEFVDELTEASTVVLELSSFQLGDLSLTGAGIAALQPRVSLITSIYRDHLNYYDSMEDYVADKRLIYASQRGADWTIARNDTWGRSFLRETPARGAVTADAPLDPTEAGAAAGAWLDGRVGIARVPDDGGSAAARTAAQGEEILPERLLVPGAHMRRNLLAAGLVCRLLGVGADAIRHAAAGYPGIEHRLELTRERDGVRYYNDSAATIPEATLEAVGSFDAPVHLIAGGTDKNIDFALFSEIAARVAGLYLLEGNATPAILEVLGGRKTAGLSPRGPFASLEDAVSAAAGEARAGEVVILSPGCASFGMFRNEFDRGRRFRDIVQALE
ncbi:MAG: UDP-N-acetylmuramoyl-L-alanine--D-glutamate ligase [Spirochaetaceae bacterium]